jgi:LmbE family N-acetylglucosaminyl deacetylase
MASKMDLVVVAHPDDETIFFSGLLQSRKKRPWHVICVTDGNADGNGTLRHQQFATAMKFHGVKHFEMWDFPDVFERRLDVSLLVDRLRTVAPADVFTHGVLGEYGHPHHQDVCMAAHLAFKKVYSVAYNIYPELRVNLTPRQFALKAKVLAQVYQSETRRFIQSLPASSSEGFAHFTRAEVQNIYDWLVLQKAPTKPIAKKLRWFLPYLEQLANERPKRPF